MLTGNRDVTLSVNKGATKSRQEGTALEPSQLFTTNSVPKK
jgi:hypothetical protein